MMKKRNPILIKEKNVNKILDNIKYSQIELPEEKKSDLLVWKLV